MGRRGCEGVVGRGRVLECGLDGGERLGGGIWGGAKAESVGAGGGRVAGVVGRGCCGRCRVRAERGRMEALKRGRNGWKEWMGGNGSGEGSSGGHVACGVGLVIWRGVRKQVGWGVLGGRVRAKAWGSVRGAEEAGGSYRRDGGGNGEMSVGHAGWAWVVGQEGLRGGGGWMDRGGNGRILGGGGGREGGGVKGRAEGGKEGGGGGDWRGVGVGDGMGGRIRKEGCWGTRNEEAWTGVGGGREVGVVRR
ncbi:hypothetical protein Tco_0555748 [Tanacetum coccineum]